MKILHQVVRAEFNFVVCSCAQIFRAFPEVFAKGTADRYCGEPFIEMKKHIEEANRD